MTIIVSSCHPFILYTLPLNHRQKDHIAAGWAGDGGGWCDRRNTIIYGRGRCGGHGLGCGGRRCG